MPVSPTCPFPAVLSFLTSDYLHVAYSYFASTYWPHLPTFGSCAGEEHAAFFGCGLLTSYLFLFIDFYVRTYKKTGNKKVSAEKAAKTIANGSGNGVAVNGTTTNGKAH